MADELLPPGWIGWRGPSRQAFVLDELWAALGRDPFVIAAMPGAASG